MPFTTPLALLGLLFVPAVIAMYLLKLRRDNAPVSSTLLWTKLVADVEANAPWQRLRRSLLLLLQLLLVLLLVLLAARPFVERPAGLAGDIVLVIDTSASMNATDVRPSRLEAAKTAAVDALRLASALAARAVDSEIVVATDAALARTPRTRTEAPIRVIQVGTEPKNQAIAALSIRTAASGLTKSAFVSVANLDLATVKRRIEVYGDGNLLEARDVYLDPQARADIVVDDITQQNTRDVDVVEVRLVADDDEGDTTEDRLAVDDRAWAIVPTDELRQILLVGGGGPFPQTPLGYL